MFHTRKYFGRFLVLAIFIATPLTSSAQAFVPVRDQTLINTFNGFVSSFNNTFGGQPNGSSNAIRDLISGGNIRSRDDGGNLTTFGRTYGDCVTGDAELTSRAYSQTSPWGLANTNDQDIPLQYPAQNTLVQVNKSESLRCLLMEIVQFQKLSASTQIHQVLLEYLTKAQTKQRANKLSGEIAAADINFLKEGYSSQNGGVSESAPLYVTSPEEYRNKEGEREVSYFADQIVNDENDAVSGLGYCDAFKIDAAQQAIASGESLTDNEYDESESAVGCTMDQPNGGIFGSQDDYYRFMNDPKTPEGPGADVGFMWLLNNPQNAKITNLDMTNEIASRRVESAQEEFDQVCADGVCPTPNNPDDPANPYGVRKFRTYVSPASQNEDALISAASEGKRQIQDTEYTGSEPRDPAREQASEVNTSSGISGFNTQRLANSPNMTNAMIKELYNILYTGYFDVNLNTTNWARATMLMIYDEMNFNDSTLSDSIPETAANTQGADTQTPDPRYQDWY